MLSYRLNKPKTGRLWFLPALQYFYASASFQIKLIAIVKELTLICQLLSLRAEDLRPGVGSVV